MGKGRNLTLMAALLAMGGCTYNYSEGEEESEEGKNGDTSAGTNSCDNSPFTGKYMRNLANCSWTMSKPFQDDCTGTWEPDRRSHLNLDFTYAGTSIYADEHWDSGEIVPGAVVFDFIRNPTRSQLDPSLGESRTNRYLCFMSKDTELFGIVNEDGLVEPRLENVFRVSDSTIPAGRECRQEEKKRKWYTECTGN